VHGQALSISITCGDPDSARILSAQLQRLDDGLRAAGLEPHALTVAGHA
jgi:hypothetical protein